MNTTTNTRGVSEAMVAELIAAGDFLAMNGTDGMVRRWEKAKAALSAEPAAQGEEGFDARKYVRHMADVLEAGGDLFKVDADLLRLAAAINKAANIAPPAQLAERVPEGLLRKALTIAANIRTADWLEAGGTVREQDELAAYLAASPAPSPARGDGGEG